MRIKREHFWPSFCVFILAISFVANAILVYASQSDGGARPIPNTYEKAVEESKRE